MYTSIYSKLAVVGFSELVYNYMVNNKVLHIKQEQVDKHMTHI